MDLLVTWYSADYKALKARLAQPGRVVPPARPALLEEPVNLDLKVVKGPVVHPGLQASAVIEERLVVKGLWGRPGHPGLMGVLQAPSDLKEAKGHLV